MQCSCSYAFQRELASNVATAGKGMQPETGNNTLLDIEVDYPNSVSSLEWFNDHPQSSMSLLQCPTSPEPYFWKSMQDISSLHLPHRLHGRATYLLCWWSFQDHRRVKDLILVIPFSHSHSFPMSLGDWTRYSDHEHLGGPGSLDWQLFGEWNTV